MTQIGMLGTFLGIVIGLWDFNPGDIDGSIPQLLNGLKTAFITSITGLFSSMLLNIVKNIRPPPEEEYQEAGAAEIITALQEQTRILTKELTELKTRVSSKNAASVASQLIALRKSISGNEDSSLQSQVKLLRTDISDTQKAAQQTLAEVLAQVSGDKTLNERLATLEELLSKSATEIVIEALKETIREFNDKITEQFGDNFKQLNQSVEKLVTWQDNYAEQLTQMTTLFDKTTTSISSVDESIGRIKDSTSPIPEYMDSLQQIMQTNDLQLQEMQRHLEAFANLKEAAQQALPQTKEYLEETVASIENLQSEVTDKIRGTLESTLTQTGETLRTEIREYNQIMSDNNEKSLQELADALAGITGKFVEDYGKLVAQMDRVINTR